MQYSYSLQLPLLMTWWLYRTWERSTTSSSSLRYISDRVAVLQDVYRKHMADTELVMGVLGMASSPCLFSLRSGSC
jgi:hypothetical protein